MTVSSKIMSIVVISIFEIGSVPTLRQFHETSFFGHLCHFLCHLHQFRDKILKNHAHIRNQHVSNRLCTVFETILRKFDFAQKFFGGSTSGPQRRKGLRYAYCPKKQFQKYGNSFISWTIPLLSCPFFGKCYQKSSILLWNKVEL